MRTVAEAPGLPYFRGMIEVRACPLLRLRSAPASAPRQRPPRSSAAMISAAKSQSSPAAIPASVWRRRERLATFGVLARSLFLTGESVHGPKRAQARQSGVGSIGDWPWLHGHEPILWTGR